MAMPTMTTHRGHTTSAINGDHAIVRKLYNFYVHIVVL